MAKVEFNVGIDYIVELVEKSFKYHNRIMNSIHEGTSLYLKVDLHEEYTESMELLMQNLQEKFEGIRTYLHQNMYKHTRDELEEEKLIVLKEIDTAFEEKGIYKSNGVTSPYNPLDMVKTTLPYEPSDWMKDLLARSPKNPNIRKLK